MSAAPARLPTMLPTTCGVSRGAELSVSASAADPVAVAAGAAVFRGPPPPPGYVVMAASEAVAVLPNNEDAVSDDDTRPDGSEDGEVNVADDCVMLFSEGSSVETKAAVLANVEFKSGFVAEIGAGTALLPAGFVGTGAEMAGFGLAAASATGAPDGHGYAGTDGTSRSLGNGGTDGTEGTDAIVGVATAGTTGTEGSAAATTGTEGSVSATEGNASTKDGSAVATEGSASATIDGTESSGSAAAVGRMETG